MREPPSDGSLIHHADHGSQYTSIALTSRLAKAGIAASMGTVGDSFDNALAENMWSVIKTERLRRRDLLTRADAERKLFEYIDGFYNTRRIQKALGWRLPDEYEAAYRAGQNLAVPATKQVAAAGRTPGQALSSVAHRSAATGDEAPDTAGVPSGVAGSGAKVPGTGRNRDREQSRNRHPTRFPRERRGVGQRPTPTRPTPERTKPNQRILTNRNRP